MNYKKPSQFLNFIGNSGFSLIMIEKRQGIIQKLIYFFLTFLNLNIFHNFFFLFNLFFEFFKIILQNTFILQLRASVIIRIIHNIQQILFKILILLQSFNLLFLILLSLLLKFDFFLKLKNQFFFLIIQFRILF